MTQATARTASHHSKLVRLLGELTGPAQDAASADFAERLGQMFGFSEALVLSAANTHRPAINGEVLADDARHARIEALEAEILQVRAGLVTTIVKSCTPGVGPTRIKLPAVTASAEGEPLAYEPFHRFHAAHQREMHWHLRNLQASVRNAVSTASPALKQLALLDAAFDEILQERSRKLFNIIPNLLHKRFTQLYEAHQHSRPASVPVESAPVASTPVDRAPVDPSLWLRPGGWLARFCAELQDFLLAELDVRLQPVLGLVDALRHEVHTHS